MNLDSVTKPKRTVDDVFDDLIDHDELDQVLDLPAEADEQPAEDNNELAEDELEGVVSS